MHDDLGFGPRLTDEEYEKRIVELYRGRQPLPSRAEDDWLRRQELDLAIDHRLGREFPRDRREQLWAVRQRLERKRLRLGVKYLLSRWIRRFGPRDSRRLAQLVYHEYARVLSGAELERFLSLEEGDRPGLPFDREEQR